MLGHKPAYFLPVTHDKIDNIEDYAPNYMFPQLHSHTRYYIGQELSKLMKRDYKLMKLVFIFNNLIFTII